ncbi:MAG: putative CRISPR-associated protein [Limnospira sp. PMC 1291.21]|uniref:CRISPR-associated protein n=1 Tax=Limnospira fusiformis PMC 851.14 TaxID=2219512 RepID=A0ABU9EI93_LIMFS|nr:MULTISPECIES: putative CRISPR-associated protein [unclassified Limnospira]MDT9176089.1 putative CRISPR-associated protein [Limnospira sp. PMC 1238.20]MDT9191408.1 putative CRISPR-associated protein [Limnospira sp. PMC 1245.20]MDT9204979.1 putative CRISPR-associated protein [Limnospira sp. PMC 1243.20]MDT9206787.1 putative CRISPR-associated protein [Limnospira sp. PMC 1252.20]MDT9211851.1 putative CRISPR-associated protein [Limnospira sp. PMC 1256.20]
MQTIIMTVGTSLRTNPDRNLPEDKKRPWAGKFVPNNERAFSSLEEPLAWMKTADMEAISAETNTFWRLDPLEDDRILLLHSDTPSGQECAEVLQAYLQECHGQKYVTLEKIPDINYELDEGGSALDRMAQLLRTHIQEAQAAGLLVTLAATGGFKAQTMVMGLVGNALGVPVCYVHESYKTLVYLPYIDTGGLPQPMVRRANLPESGRSRDDVIQVQGDKKGHHRPKSWKKVEKLLQDLPWVDLVRFDKNAFSAPKNGVKSARQKTTDGCHVLWLHLHDSDTHHIAVSVETTGYKPEHLTEATAELREKLGRIV